MKMLTSIIKIFIFALKVFTNINAWSSFENADLCSSANIDAITRTASGKTFVFKGSNYWRISSTGILKGYPKVIENDWSGLPNDLDAALSWRDGKTFFFKEYQYWRYSGMTLDSGFPKNISFGFKGIPDDIDAAFGQSSKTYFFKGDSYWRYDNKRKSADDGYPKNIIMWKGVPSDLNGAFQWEDDRKYFFKGKNSYQFDNVAFQVSKVETIASRLFKCTPTSTVESVNYTTPKNSILNNTAKQFDLQNKNDTITGIYGSISEVGYSNLAEDEFSEAKIEKFESDDYNCSSTIFPVTIGIIFYLVTALFL